MIDRSGISDRIHLIGYVTDEQLQALYHSATVYVHPSLFEGFGLPVLEAMAAGCPVVTSSISSLPEVAGDGAILVPPSDERALASALNDVLSDQEARGALSRAGLKRSSEFTWERTAQLTMDVYRGLLP